MWTKALIAASLPLPGGIIGNPYSKRDRPTSFIPVGLKQDGPLGMLSDFHLFLTAYFEVRKDFIYTRKTKQLNTLFTQDRLDLRETYQGWVTSGSQQRIHGLLLMGLDNIVENLC